MPLFGLTRSYKSNTKCACHPITIYFPVLNNADTTLMHSISIQIWTSSYKESILIINFKRLISIATMHIKDGRPQTCDWCGSVATLDKTGPRYVIQLELQFISSFIFSGGQKWFHRRKLLTPTFHFSILQSFMEVFNEQSMILVEKLGKYADKSETVNIFPLVTHCVLDIICGIFSLLYWHVSQSYEKGALYAAPWIFRVPIFIFILYLFIYWGSELPEYPYIRAVEFPNIHLWAARCPNNLIFGQEVPYNV